VNGRIVSTRTLLVIASGLLSMLVLYTVLPLLPADGLAQSISTALATLVPVGIAAGVAIWAAFTFPAGSRLRLAWLFMGLSILSYECASLVWAFSEIVRGVPPASPGLIDLLYLVGYPLTMLALISGIGALRRDVDPMPLMLTSFVVCAGVAVLLWILVLRPVVATPADLVNAIYSLGDLVLVLPLGITLAYLVNRLGRRRDALAWWVVIAAFMFALADDTLFTMASASGAYLSGGPADVGLTLGYLTLGVAASLAVDVTRAGGDLSGGRASTEQPDGGLERSDH